ncbi:nucleobase:cation symporter-2 family protein [Kitasatospora atroaurantiaca]|uniref:NCS2 family nucleobase:cation symporter-2 n=1 Tax=Kitasatospora atroaurantiaca TaxID=285545 RepID=A0A561EXL5_9ACTN|nr:nucleobase:cation symporter-2 family protein [Kitasatospora atroaurantiaca]TWE20355.1 NCS2 family nucleobase:cation symporter-2 [Kitasatospora atroaurantiaca]
MQSSQSERSSPAEVHPVDEVLPAPRLAILGLQHVFIMYAGAVAVPFIVGSALKLDMRTIALLVNADLLVAGIATIIQAVGISKIFGVRLPVVAGATFTVVSPMITIAAKHGLPTVYGAMLCSGVFGLLIAKPFSKMIKFFPPLVAGTVIAVIGLSLIGPGAGMIAGHNTGAADYGQVSHIALGFGVIALIVVFSKVLRGFLGQIAPLLALVVGTLVSIPMHLLHLDGVKSADWIGIASPFHFGAPRFDAAAIISMCIVMLVTYTESTADMLAVAEMTGKELTDGDIARGLATDGLSAVLGGTMNSFPDTAYAENVGLVQMTGVRSRWVVAVAGCFLLVMGLVPKVGAFVAAVPEPVVGGAALVMFAMVTAVGIQTLKKVDFTGNHNFLVVAVSLGVGMLPAVATDQFGNEVFFKNFPDWTQIIFGSPITLTVILAFGLNLVFNHLTAPRSRTALPHQATSTVGPDPVGPDPDDSQPSTASL